MINPQYTEMLKQKDIIFEIFQYALEKAKIVGADNILDFSLGNPSVPAPSVVNETLIAKINSLNPLSLHGYSPGLGVPEARAAIAESISRRFGVPYKVSNIYMTIGAADALGHALRAVNCPGDEVICFAPCFSEYTPYMAGARLVQRIVPADIDTFQINFDEFEKMMNPKVTSVLINSPSNPSGTLYSEETLKHLAEILTRKSEEYGHPIYLISDEPYRELAYDGAVVPYVTKYYNNTIVGYSYSKSLSLPGERIGYIVIPDELEDAENVFAAASIATRVSGSVNAPSLMQLVIEKCVDAQCDVAAYDKNRNALYNGLTELGFECIKPQGAFYLWMKTPVEEKEFVSKCKEYNILPVGGTSFACPGYVRFAYCVSYDTIMNSMKAFAKVAEFYGLKK